MKLLFPSRFAVAIGFIVLPGASLLQAEFIQPVAALASNNPATQEALILDGMLLTASVVKVSPITTITHKPATPFQPGSTHALKVEAKDTAGTNITNESTFSLPAPFFPLTGLGEPLSTAGKWGFRTICNAGRADALVSAVGIALQANQPAILGDIRDTAVPFINFAKTTNPGAGGRLKSHLRGHRVPF